MQNIDFENEILMHWCEVFSSPDLLLVFCLGGCFYKVQVFQQARALFFRAMRCVVRSRMENSRTENDEMELKILEFSRVRCKFRLGCGLRRGARRRHVVSYSGVLPSLASTAPFLIASVTCV